MGLGKTPSVTAISTVSSPQGSDDVCTGALNNFWRSAENFATIPSGGDMLWTASHGCSLRSVQVSGSLSLSQVTSSGVVGASTGAFIANCFITNAVNTSQRQLCVRNSEIGATGINLPWNAQSLGQIWGQTFVGCIGAPETFCGNCNPSSNGVQQFPGADNIVRTSEEGTDVKIFGCTCRNVLCPNTTDKACVGVPANNILNTPLIAEKPFIYYDSTNPSNKYFLAVPHPAEKTKGPSGFVTFTSKDIPFKDNVYVATPSDNADKINSMIVLLKAVILTPGTYLLDKPLLIDKDNFVLLGIGFPILIPTNQTECITVGDVDGVQIGGIILQAGPRNPSTGATSDSLLRWGPPAASNVTSGYLYDCFARVGRFSPDAECNFVGRMFAILSSNIVCDNVWARRADHGPSGLSGDCPIATCPIGAQIKGDGVIAYGLACENTFGATGGAFGNLLDWFGNNGQCYSFQGTFPPDGQPRSSNTYGSCGYQLDIKVINHLAFDVGIYSRLQSPDPITVRFGIFSPTSVATPTQLQNQGNEGIEFIGAFTRILSGNGIINKVINSNGFNSGKQADPFQNQSVDANFPGPAYTDNNCVWGTFSDLRDAFQTNAGR
jgi:hypothetical protein